MGENVKVLAILPAIIPSTTILVVDPLMHLLDLEKINLRVRLEKFDIQLSDLEWADLVIFCRNVEPIDSVLERLLTIGKPYIYELDDNFFELPLDTPEGIYYRDINRITMLEKYIRHANLVRVYSSPLENRVREYTSKVNSVKAPVNMGYIPSTPPLRNPQKIKIVFSTSRTAFDKLTQIFMGDLIRILREYGDDVEAHFWGYMPVELRGLRSVKFHRFMSNYPKYMRTIYNSGYDIGLAPMKNDLFHNSKTNNKFREYGACWVAGVYSNAEVYTSCVANNRTGLLVSNEEDAWYRAIKKLIDDPLLRESIQVEARAFVEKEYALNTFALSLMNDINQTLTTSPNTPVSKQFSDSSTAAINGRAGMENVVARLIKTSLSRIQRAPKSIQDYGLMLTIRLVFEQMERYVRYFELNWKINQRGKK